MTDEQDNDVYENLIRLAREDSLHDLSKTLQIEPTGLQQDEKGAVHQQSQVNSISPAVETNSSCNTRVPY